MKGKKDCVINRKLKFEDCKNSLEAAQSENKARSSRTTCFCFSIVTVDNEHTKPMLKRKRRG